MSAPNQDNTTALEDYFPLDWRGDPMAEASLRDDRHGWVNPLYECTVCRAIVMDARGHAKWHEEDA